MFFLSRGKRPFATVRFCLQIVMAALLLCSAGAAQTWSWRTETVDGTGDFTSLAIDKTDSLHLSYVRNGLVMYAFRPANVSRWFQTPIAKSNSYTAVAVGPDNNPHICFTGYGALRYAAWDGKQWNGQEIAPKSGNIGYACAVAVALDGTPNVLWYQLSLNGLNFFHLRHAALKNGAWQARVVDPAMETGKWNSLRIDGSGNPHVTYSVHSIGQVRYGVWDGKSWTSSTIEARAARSALHPGYGNSLALAADGSPAVSYLDGEDLKFARLKPDGKWQVETIDSAPATPVAVLHSSLALDRQGLPHIAYADSGTLKHAFYDGKQWHVQIVAPRGTIASASPAMVINSEGVIYLAFRDPQDGSVKVAVGTLSAANKADEKPSADAAGQGTTKAPATAPDTAKPETPGNPAKPKQPETPGNPAKPKHLKGDPLPESGKH